MISQTYRNVDGRQINADGFELTPSNSMQRVVTVGLSKEDSDYGPHTAGTTTCGIQEAIHALTQQTTLSGLTGGGIVQIAAGRWSCSGQITIPNQFNFEIQLRGSGKIATQLLYTGTLDFIVNENTTSALPGGSKPMQFYISDICFIYQNDTSLKRIIYFQNTANQGVIRNCSFTVLQCINFISLGVGGVQGQGGGLLFIGGTPQNAVGIIGVQVDGGFDNKMLFEKCDFYGLAVGIIYTPDHGVFRDCMFTACGRWYTTITLAAHDATAWTPIVVGNLSQMANNINAVGGCISFNGNIYEMTVDNCYFFESRNGVLNSNWTGFGPILRMINCHGESITNFMACGIDQNNESLTFGSVLSIGDRGVGGYAYFSLLTGAMGGAPVTKPSVYELNVAPSGGAMKFTNAYVGTTLFVADNEGIHPQLMTKATRNALAATFGAVPAGTVVYQTDNTPGLRTYNGTNWMRYTETADP